ncbi:MAG: A/G-specific adenine glycosylase, partial [Candidatus Eisenbacteria bacterium]
MALRALSSVAAAHALDAPALHRSLVAWFRRHQRAMPWRATRDAYRVWVSEIMLQQTQVVTATPYYLRFTKRFPKVSVLAAASLDDVLAVWAGLGYYRRARMLHEAARTVVREHAGRIPRTPEAFAALPGVGRYTVGAVLSISAGRPLPVLDGNVARVLSRWTALPLAVKRPADAKRLWALAESLMPVQRARGAAIHPGDWNQALMELGAIVCTPRPPACERCPVRAQCRAFALGRVGEFPPVMERRGPELVRRAVVLIEHRGRVLVTRRQGALLAGLWEPPGVELWGQPSASAHALRALLRTLGLRVRLRQTGQRVKHTITHRSIEVEVWRGTLLAPAPRRVALRWAEPDSRELALTALTR